MILDLYLGEILNHAMRNMRSSALRQCAKCHEKISKRTCGDLNLSTCILHCYLCILKIMNEDTHNLSNRLRDSGDTLSSDLAPAADWTQQQPDPAIKLRAKSSLRVKKARVTTVAKKKQKNASYTATDLVYRELKRQILVCRLAPGSVLDERSILRGLGFSRTPFREACMRLKEEGWLLSMSRRGYLIPPITLQDIADIYELRLVLESACVQIAAIRATPKDIESLEEMARLEEQPETAKLHDLLVNKNAEFHMQLAQLSRNKRIADVLQSVLEHVQRCDSMLYQHKPETPWVTHSDIVVAIRDHDPEEARKRLQLHIEEARQRLLNAFGSHSLDLRLAYTGGQAKQRGPYFPRKQKLVKQL
ncbi:MAG: GntR family transcriptional regulator [Acidobacteria bacterium]|nr:MAG: GntR family transcriptional regulator [Acidobacteriota bacterium]